MSQPSVEKPQSAKPALNIRIGQQAVSAPVQFVPRQRSGEDLPQRIVIEKPMPKEILPDPEVWLLYLATPLADKLFVNETETEAKPLNIGGASCFYVCVAMTDTITARVAESSLTANVDSSIVFMNSGVDENKFVDDFVTFLSESSDELEEFQTSIIDKLCFTEHDLQERMIAKATERGGLAKLFFEFAPGNSKEAMINAVRSFLWHMYENFEVESREMRPLERHLIDLILVIIYDYALFVPHALCLCHRNEILREKASEFFETHPMPLNLQINYDIEHFAWNMKLLEEQFPYFDDLSSLLMYSYQLGYHRTFQKLATNTIRSTDNDKVIQIFNKRWGSLKNENDELKFYFCDFVVRVLDNPQAYCKQSTEETEAMTWLRKSLE